jgi:hypothetical protein
VAELKFVTLSEFHALIERRGIENPAFARNTDMLFKHTDEWRKWPLHLQQDMFAKLGIAAIVMPLGPGGVVVSDGINTCPEGCEGCTMACPRLVRIMLRGGPWDGVETQVTRAATVCQVPHDAEGRLRSPGVEYFPTSEAESGFPVWRPSGVNTPDEMKGGA